MSYKLSVIIPVFNAEDYIKECLDSVVDQSLGIDNIEVIIVNDNSCDSTLDIISQYTDKYPSFKLISNKSNLGPGESRNMALKEVSSDYVTYLDADDFISQNAYEDALSKINEFNANDNNYLSNTRHVALMSKALDSLKSAYNACLNHIDVDMIEIDIKDAWYKLGSIIGEESPELLINELFSKFCLGK